jgi:tetratricopeptide (TPR) repeat protein
MNCANCNAALKPSTRFCPLCGQPVQAPEANRGQSDPKPLIRRAETLLREGKRQEAVPLLEEIQRVAPELFAPKQMLAELYLLGVEPEKALKLYEELTALQPGQIQLQYLLGALYRWNGLPEKALAVFEEIIQRNPSFWPAYQNRIRLCLQTNQTEIGLKALKDFAEKEGSPFSYSLETAAQALAVLPDRVEILDLLANLRLNRQEWSEAIVLLERKLQLATDSATLRQLANALEQAGQKDAAMARYEQLLQEEPSDLSARLKLAGLYGGQAQWPQAIEHYRQIVEQDPNRVEAWKALAPILETTGAKEEALTIYQRLQDAEPAAPQYREAIQRLRQELLAGTIQTVRADLIEHPEDLDKRFLLGRTLVQQGDLPAAAKEFQLAAQGSDRLAEAVREVESLRQTAPGEVAVLLVLVDLYRQQGLTAEATAIFQEYLQTQPDRFQNQLTLAELQLDAKQVEPALQALNRAIASSDLEPILVSVQLDRVLEMDPENSSAWALRAKTAQAAGDLEKAQESLQKAVSLAPDRLEWKKELAELLAKKGDFGLAVDLYREYLAGNPSDISAHLQLIHSLRASDRLEEAQSETERLLASMPTSSDAKQLQQEIRQQLQQNKIEQLKIEVDADAKASATRLALADLLLESDQWSQSQIPLEQALTLEEGNQSPAEKEALYLLATLYERQSKRDLALETLEKLKRIDPTYRDLPSKISKLAAPAVEVVLGRPGTKRFCPGCGQPIRNESRFCASCGTPLS